MNVNPLGQLVYEKNALAVDDFSINDEGELLSTTDPSIDYHIEDEELIRVGDEIIDLYH